MNRLMQRLKKNLYAIILVLAVSAVAGFGLPFLVSYVVYGVPLGSWRDREFVNPGEGLATATLDKFARGTVEIDFWVAATPILEGSTALPTATPTAVPTRTPIPTRIEPSPTKRVIEEKPTRKPTDEPPPTKPKPTKQPTQPPTHAAPVQGSAPFSVTITPHAYQSGGLRPGQVSASAAVRLQGSGADSFFSSLFESISDKLRSLAGRLLY